MIVTKSNRWLYTGVTVIVMIAVALMLFMAPPVTVAEDQSQPAMLTSSVMDDLQSATIDGQKFDIKDYPRDDTANVRVITFQEFGYGYYSSEYYGLYFYIYNPTQRAINTEGLNKITFATAYTGESATTYAKFDLEIVSVSEEPYANRFYKLRVKDPSRLLSRIGERAESRRYDVSEIELNFGGSTAEAFEVGGKFVFSGYSAGMGADSEAESTLTCTFQPIETILITGLSDRQTVYRTDMDNSNMQSHNQVNSVYFAIDNRLIEEYGRLQKIEAEWWEYRTNPIVVTNNEEFYNAVKSFLHKDIGGHTCDCDYTIYELGGSEIDSNIYWNSVETPIDKIILNRLDWLFKTKNWDDDLDRYVIESSELEDYRVEYEHSGKANFKEDNGYKYCTDLFNKEVGDGRTAGYNHKVFDSSNPDDMIDFKKYDPDYKGWDAFKNIFGWEDSFDETLTNVSPIVLIDNNNRNYYLSGSNDDIAARLLVAKEDVPDIKSYISSSLNQNQTVVLFRFAITEYYAASMKIGKYSSHSSHWQKDIGDGFFAEENVFLNFDIMSLTFNKDGVFTVIPVVSSPIDVISEIVGPALPGNGWSLMDYIYFALMVIVAVLILVVLYGLLDMISNSIMRAPARNNKNYNSRRRRR